MCIAQYFHLTMELKIPQPTTKFGSNVPAKFITQLQGLLSQCDNIFATLSILPQLQNLDHQINYFPNHLLSMYSRTSTHTAKILKWRNWAIKCFIMASSGRARAFSHPRSCWLRRMALSNFVWTTMHSTPLLSKTVSLFQWLTKSLMSLLAHRSSPN